MDKNVHVSYTFVAECPHCGDRSFPAETKGDIAITGTEFAAWVDAKEEFNTKLNKNIFVLKTKKGAKKPRVKI
jgi:predicted nucleic-acid-binding Zn-ribbon protein